MSDKKHKHNDKYKRQRDEDEPTVATGMDDDEELNEEASDEEIREGDSTRVTRLTNDADSD